MFAATIFHYYAQNYTICGMDLCILPPQAQSITEEKNY